jgi:hypothetical protein
MGKMPQVTILLMMLPALALAQGNATSSSIVAKSPFLPPGFTPPGGQGSTAGAPATSGQFQFKGVYQLGGEYYFNLYNVREKKGSWLRRGEDKEGQPRVINYQREADVLVVESEGKQLSLDLIETSDKPIPLPNPAPTARKVTPVKKPETTTSGTSTTTRRRVIRPSTRTTRQATPTRRTTLPASTPNK